MVTNGEKIDHWRKKQRKGPPAKRRIKRLKKNYNIKRVKKSK